MLPVPSIRSLFPYLQRARPKFQLPPVRKPRPQEESTSSLSCFLCKEVLLGMLLVTYLVLIRTRTGKRHRPITRIPQANLQRSWGADNLLNHLARELGADALLVSEQYRDRDPSIWIQTVSVLLLPGPGTHKKSRCGVTDVAEDSSGLGVGMLLPSVSTSSQTRPSKTSATRLIV
ncbi:hypothetical protein J6590_010924 [Homalodisca vitripennis]|nr:hypothetical protein J6590_010924 [Homalodisca vitripennis]